MWSFNTSYENPGLCTKFLGDNILGYIHVPGLIFMAVLLLGIGHRLLASDMVAFTTGHYIAFTSALLHSPLVKVAGKCLFAYLACLVLGAVLVPFVVITHKYVERTGETRHQIFIQWMGDMLLSWLLVPLSAYFLLSADVHVFNSRSVVFKSLEFRRSWFDLMVETNASFARKFDQALLQAHYGDTAQLENILVGSVELSEVLSKCAPAKAAAAAPGSAAPDSYRKM